MKRELKGTADLMVNGTSMDIKLNQTGIIENKPRSAGSTEEETKKYIEEFLLNADWSVSSKSSTKSLNVKSARAKRKKKNNHKNRQRK